MNRYLILIVIIAIVACVPITQKHGDIARWTAYYDSKLEADAFRGQDLVIFDRLHHPDFKALSGETLVFAYVSIGELHDDSPEKPALEKAGALLKANARWKSHVVDIRHALWQPLVLAAIEDATAQGFDGVMLDTIDSPLAWARNESSEASTEMQQSALALIRAIREAHPGLKIILNRGLEILPEAADQLDFILAESILTNPDDSTGQFALVSPNSYAQAATQLHQVVALNPQLHVLTLDYWDLGDGLGLEHIYSTQRANGFIPYVTSQDLRQFTPEPLFLHRVKRH